MRKFLAMLIMAGVTVLPAASATAAPSPATPTPIDAATWLAAQVTPGGYLESVYSPGTVDNGGTAQAVLALASAGIGRTQVQAMVAYLQAHVEDYVHTGTTDTPAALAYLILDAKATGLDPHDFGGTDLVARLTATQRPDGLFGLADQDPTYDGTYRQGLSLLALHEVGIDNPAGTAWLVGQKCVDGSYVSYRADTSVPCPPLDLATFTGPDTNSTAMAIFGLHANGADTTAQLAWLEAVRTGDGGFTYFGNPSGQTDGNSTGLVLAAIRYATGQSDPRAVAALTDLTVPCSSTADDRGGIAFQPQNDMLYADRMATIQALWGLGTATFPPSDVVLAETPSSVCQVAPIPPTTHPAAVTTTPVANGTPATVGAPRVDNSVGVTELPRTGGSILGIGDGAAGLVGVVLLIAGATVVAGSRRVGDRP